MKWDCKDFVKQCFTCSQIKHWTGLLLGTLHPLIVLEALWRDITIDLMIGLPLVDGYNVVYTVVDQFSKEIVVFLTTDTVSASQLAQSFWDKVWCRHGTPVNVVSNQEPQFIMEFMWQVNKILGIWTWLSLARHPKSDGQTERTQQAWQRYLRVYATEEDWVLHLLTIEFMYNLTTHNSTSLLPFYLSQMYWPHIGFKPLTTSSEA